MQKLLNADLKILYDWLLANKISLNCDKTEIIFYHKPVEKAPTMKIKMNGHRIRPSHSIKYLGMHLDETQACQNVLYSYISYISYIFLISYIFSYIFANFPIFPIFFLYSYIFFVFSYISYIFSFLCNIYS